MVIRHSLRAWLLIGLAFPGALCGQTNAVRSGGNRFLLIVETSSAMEGRKEGMLKALQDLLTSGMQGQLRAGDSLGLWTFNQALYAGRFPLQHWSAETQNEATARMLGFLNSQKFEGEASLEKILTPLEHVIQGSACLTVVLISDGEEKIHGTPFDDRINEYYQHWQKEQQKARLPFVTVLRAREGKITDYAVTASPWPLEMPALPPEPKVVEETTPANGAAAVPASNTGAPAELSAPASHAISNSAGTAAVAQVNPPNDRTATASPPTVPSATNTVPPTASNGSIGVTPATEVAAAPSAREASATDSKSTPRSAGATSGTASDIHPAPSMPAGVAAQGVVAVPSGGFFQRRGVVAVGLILAAAISGLGFMLRRRARAADRVSLITRSLEREKER